eukprot:156068-Amphidinium_carterae.1
MWSRRRVNPDPIGLPCELANGPTHGVPTVQDQYNILSETEEAWSVVKSKFESWSYRLRCQHRCDNVSVRRYYHTCTRRENLLREYNVMSDLAGPVLQQLA